MSEFVRLLNSNGVVAMSRKMPVKFETDAATPNAYLDVVGSYDWKTNRIDLRFTATYMIRNCIKGSATSAV
jgi:hypothetical protein